jgi:hypothetical protein
MSVGRFFEAIKANYRDYTFYVKQTRYSQTVPKNNYYFLTIFIDCLFKSRSIYLSTTVCSTDLDQGSEMINFESILTTLIAIVVFRGDWGSGKKWLELKIENYNKQI